MSLLSNLISITRYRVEGRVKTPVLETVAAGLKKNAISEIDDQSEEKAVGWTSFKRPYQPDFSGSDFVYGNYLVFSRIQYAGINCPIATLGIRPK